jgi:lysophospholipid acyltransferase (LPLAT)-like uncharacterized protein
MPCSFSCRRRIVLGTWDRFLLPLPFTRGVILWGDPIRVPRDASPEVLQAAKLQVEAALTGVTQTADAIMGVDTVQPAQVEAAA